MPNLAKIFAHGVRVNNPYDLIRDFRRSFQKPLYEEVIENAMYYSPPYLPVYGFIDKTKEWPMKYFSVKEWEAGELDEAFTSYIQQNYSTEYQKEIKEQISHLLKHLKVRKNKKDD